VEEVNIEFEAKLYRDISAPYCCQAFFETTAPKNVKEGYRKWVDTLWKNPSSLTQNDYQKWLNLFNQYTNKEYSSPLSPHLNTPDALNSIITLSKCF
jgi:hypothetical protein